MAPLSLAQLRSDGGSWPLQGGAFESSSRLRRRAGFQRCAARPVAPETAVGLRGKASARHGFCRRSCLPERGVDAGELATNTDSWDASPPQAPGEGRATTAASSSATEEPKVGTAFTLRGKLLQHRVELPLANGQRLTVQALTEERIEATCDILTSAFVTAKGGFSSYNGYVKRQIGQYLAQQVNLPPCAVVLVATLSDPLEQQQQQQQQQDDVPSATAAEARAPGEDEEEAAGGPEGGPPSQKPAPEQLVGTLELSFSASTRSTYLTLNPPRDCIYLCNMAVDGDYRGRGYGRMLLQAAESFAALSDKEEIFLHVRLQDHLPYRLYSSNGYTQLEKDNWLVGLLGMDRRFLMRKQLGKGGHLGPAP